MQLRISLFISLIFTFLTVFSQESENAKSYYDKGFQLFSDNEIQEAVAEFQAAIEEEKMNGSSSPDFLGECYFYLARTQYELNNFNSAISSFKSSLDYYRKSGNDENIKNILLWLASSYQSLQYANQKLGIIPEKLAEKWVTFSVDSIFLHRNDTMWVIFSGGSNDSIIDDIVGSAFSTYSSENPERGNLILGSAHMMLSEKNAAICYAVLNNTTDSSRRVMVGDLVEFKCMLPEANDDFIFTKLSQYSIQFNDIEGKPIFDQMEMLYNTDKLLEENILDFMVADIYETWESLQDYLEDFPSWTEPQPGGKFKGMSLMDAMEATTRADIAAFLNFVISFPGKYMGNKWKINETYATWIINETPLGEFDENMYKNILELESDEFDTYAFNTKFYVQDSTLEKYYAFASEEINAKNYAKADTIINKMIRLCEIQENTAYKSYFLVNKGINKAAQEKWTAAIEDYNKAIECFPKNLNAHYYRGNALGQVKDYYHAVKNYQYVIDSLPELGFVYGQQGWFLLLDGKIFEAHEVCKKAYELDPGQLTHNINYGHTFLMLKDTTNARKIYDKTLELVSSKKEFYTGPVEDFNILIENNWYKNLAEYYQDYMLKRFNEQYKYNILADSIGTVAIELKDMGAYDEALKCMLKAYEYEQQGKKPRDYWLYWQSSWIGYIYQQMAHYDSADYYYKKCLHYAHDVLDDDSKTANIYDLLSWNSDKWGKKTDYYSYLEKSEAYKRKHEESNKERRLFFLAAAQNKHDDLEYKYAEDDAIKISELFSENPSNYYDSVFIQVINSEDLNLKSLEKAFRNVILESRPDDIFIFYLGGTGALDTSKFNLQLPYNDSIETKASIEVNTIKSWLSSIQARNQFLILDIFAPTFIDEFVGNYALSRGALAGSNLNLNIISLTGHRLEEDSLKHGLLSHSLIQVLNNSEDENEKKSLSIKDLNSELFKTNNEGIITWNTYHTGNDFLLMVYDSLGLAEKRTRASIHNKRGVGTIAMEVDEEGDLYVGESKNYALIFATDHYEEWDDLVNPVFDATAMAGTLKDFYGFEVELLTNNSRMDVLTKIREYQKRQYNKNDQLFIFFAGHGSFDEISGEGYIVCSDSKKDDEIKATYIPYSYLRENVNNIRKCNHILIALDVCFGGTFDKQVSRSSRGNNDYNQISKNAFINRAMQFKSRLFITSGSKEYVSDGDPGKHSPFAYRILDVLRSQGMSNGYVTFNILVNSVERLQTTPRYGDFGDNEPGSEFIFSLEMEAPQRAFKVKDLK